MGILILVRRQICRESITWKCKWINIVKNRNHLSRIIQVVGEITWSSGNTDCGSSRPAIASARPRTCVGSRCHPLIYSFIHSFVVYPVQHFFPFSLTRTFTSFGVMISLQLRGVSTGFCSDIEIDKHPNELIVLSGSMPIYLRNIWLFGTYGGHRLHYQI